MEIMTIMTIMNYHEGWSPTRVTPSSNFLRCPIKMSRGSIVGWGQRYCLLPLVLLSRLCTRSTIGESFLYFQKVIKKNQRTTEYTSNRVISPSKASCSRWTSQKFYCLQKSCNLRVLAWKIFGPKIRLYKVFDKFQVCEDRLDPKDLHIFLFS